MTTIGQSGGGRIPRVLSIAGSDSGGGAGIQADLKAFAVCGVHGMTAITAITAQNTVGVTAVHTIPPDIILAQFRAVVSDIGVDAVKVGMLGTVETIEAVLTALDELPDGTPVVIDPVMVAESGAELLEAAARQSLIERLLPKATVVTPNVPEARELAGSGQPGSGQPGSGQPGYDQPGPGRGGPGSGNTLTSHRREFGVAGPGQPAQPGGGQPPSGRPRGPSWYRKPRWLALAAVLVLLAAGLGIWAGLNGSGSHPRAIPTMTPKPKPPAPSALMSALAVTNQSSDAAGRLPSSTCKQQGSATVTCVSPAPGINEVVFRTYPSLTALYNAYMAEVASLNSSGQFKQNYSDCQLEQTVGEVGWNHQFQHPKTYTVSQMSMGNVTDDQAAGRVFCNFTQGLEYMVWTQDDGRLMGVVAGAPHENVWNWWVAIHHNIGLGGAPMNMNPSASASPPMSSMSPSASMSSTGG